MDARWPLSEHGDVTMTARTTEARTNQSTLHAMCLLMLSLSSGCGVGNAIGGKPEIARHEYPQDGVVCYLATGYGPRNYEVSMSCVKTKVTP